MNTIMKEEAASMSGGINTDGAVVLVAPWG